MNELFSLPLERHAGAQVRLLDPRFAAAMEETFAQMHQRLASLMEQKATRLAQRTVTFRRWAQVLIPASLLGACMLVLYSRRVLRRQFLLPMQRLKEGFPYTQFRSPGTPAAVRRYRGGARVDAGPE